MVDWRDGGHYDYGGQGGVSQGSQYAMKDSAGLKSTNSSGHGEDKGTGSSSMLDGFSKDQGHYAGGIVTRQKPQQGKGTMNRAGYDADMDSNQYNGNINPAG